MHRRAAGNPGSLHPRDGADGGQRLLVETDHLGIGVIAGVGNADARHDDILRLKAGVAVEQGVERVAEREHRGEQHHAQRELHGNQGRAQGAPATRRGRGTEVAAQQPLHRDAAKQGERQQTRSQGCGKREQRAKAEYAPVPQRTRDVNTARQLLKKD
jgi:hypothetical protein